MIVRVRDLIEKLKEFDEDRFVLVHTARDKERFIREVVIDYKQCVKIQLKGADDK